MPRRRRPQPTTDGWSSIPGTNRAPRQLSNSATGSHLSQVLSSDHEYTTVAALTVRLNTARATVLATAALSSVLEAASRVHATRMFVLGLGSFHGVVRNSAMLQLALALEILAALPTKPRVLVRDPVFTSTDLEFLGKLGLETSTSLEHCGSQDQDAKVVVVAPHLEYPVLKKVLKEEQEWVKLLVSNDLREFLELQVCAAETAMVFREFVDFEVWRQVTLKEKEKRELEGVGEGRAFNDLAVYLRAKRTKHVKSQPEKDTDLMSRLKVKEADRDSKDVDTFKKADATRNVEN